MNTRPFIFICVTVALLGAAAGYVVATANQSANNIGAGEVNRSSLPSGEGQPGTQKNVLPATGTGDARAAPSLPTAGGFSRSVIAGTVSALKESTLVVETSEGQQSVNLTKTTQVITQSTLDTARQKLVEGVQVTAVGARAPDGAATVTTLTVGSSFAGEMGRRGSSGAVSGVIKGGDGNNLTIQTEEGPISVLLTSGTTVIVGSSIDEARDTITEGAKVRIVALNGEGGALSAVVVALGDAGFGGGRSMGGNAPGGARPQR